MNERHFNFWTLIFLIGCALSTAAIFSNAPRSLPDDAQSSERSIVEIRNGIGLPLCADVRSGRCRLFDSVSHRWKPVAGFADAESELHLACRREGTRQVQTTLGVAPTVSLAKLQI